MIVYFTLEYIHRWVSELPIILSDNEGRLGIIVANVASISLHVFSVRIFAVSITSVRITNIIIPTFAYTHVMCGCCQELWPEANPFFLDISRSTWALHQGEKIKANRDFIIVIVVNRHDVNAFQSVHRLYMG